MKHAPFFAVLASACIGLQAHAQFLTYPLNTEMILEGDIQGETIVSALVPFPGTPCPWTPLVSSPSPGTPPTHVALNPSGNSDSRNGFAIVTNTCPDRDAEAMTRFGMVLAGTASTSQLSVNYASSGELRGFAINPQPPCSLPGGPTTASYQARVNHGTNLYEVTIPFTVTTKCFAVADVSLFQGLGGETGSMSVTWDADICGFGDTLGVHANQPLSVDYAACCVDPGPYELTVRLSGDHAIGGTVNCFDPHFADDDVFVEVGFALNINFQDYCTCPGDSNNDGVVDNDDFIAVILGWGPCPPSATPCPGDVDHNGVVNNDDLILVQLSWGECPCCLE